MVREDSRPLFEGIAGLYGLFYRRQKRGFRRAVARAEESLDIRCFRSALDVGCGTGALCEVLHSLGLETTGFDQAARMIAFARSRPGNRGVRFVQGNALQGLPFEDRYFDLSFATHVAHGMGREARLRLYAQMSRVTRHAVVIHDYAGTGSPLTALLERLERSDYRYFVARAGEELTALADGPGALFEEVRSVPVGKGTIWYVCRLRGAGGAAPRSPREETGGAGSLSS